MLRLAPRAAATFAVLALVACADDHRPPPRAVRGLDGAVALPASENFPIPLGDDTNARARLDASVPSLDAGSALMDARYGRSSSEGGACVTSWPCERLEPLGLDIDRSITDLSPYSFEACRDGECITSGLSGLQEALNNRAITLSFQNQLDAGRFLAVWVELRDYSDGQRLVFAWEDGGFDALPVDRASFYSLKLFDESGNEVSSLSLQHAL